MIERLKTVCLVALLVPGAFFSPARAETVVDVGTRLQLFIDDQLIGRLDNVELRLQEPVRMPMAEQPFAGMYATVIKDGDLYRAYWREAIGTYGEDGYFEIYRYAESRDGHEWDFPSLGQIEINGSTDNNVMFRSVHNFSPFLDSRPGVDPAERYKALAGRGALQAFVSPDGVHWQSTYVMVRNARGGPPRTGAVIERGPDVPKWDVWMDSQNVAFWSEAEQLYVCYFRTRARHEGYNRPVRVISRTTAADFLGEWSKPVMMEGNLPGENLYTSQTHPYFRAPHIYLAFPTRLMENRGSSTDILFMATRPGSTRYERLFTEAFIRPGPFPERWGNRANYVALNVVPTGPAEMSIYHQDGSRYVLRTDGFVAARAGAAGGELTTRPLKFEGRQLLINFSTSAAGSVQVEVQDEDGEALPGFRLADCPPVIGDQIDRPVIWRGDPDLAALAGQPVRLRFVMVDADLFSFRFAARETEE